MLVPTALELTFAAGVLYVPRDVVDISITEVHHSKPLYAVGSDLYLCILLHRATSCRIARSLLERNFLLACFWYWLTSSSKGLVLKLPVSAVNTEKRQHVAII